MSNKISHRSPKGEKPVASKPTDAAVARPKKQIAPDSTHSILGDLALSTFSRLGRAATTHLIAGATIVGVAAKKIKAAAEPIIGEARHAYQRMRLDQLRGEAHGLPMAFGARLEQLAPDLQTYEPGLNQDAIGKDLDEAAYLIGEYQALGRLPLLHGLTDTVSEKYQAAFAEAVGSAEVRVQQRIIERHQLINQFYHIQEQGQTFEAPAILKQRIGELTAVGDLNEPLAEVTDQPRFVAASQGLANLTELYGLVARAKTDHAAPGVVRVADATAAWASDQLTTHFERYWDPENSETLGKMASQHGKALGSAVILDRTRFESDATREQKFNALAGMNDADTTSWEHALLVIRHTETVVVPREAANERRKQLDPRSGFRTAWQLEYTGFGWGGVAADRTGILKTVDDVGKVFGITDLVGETLNDNVITRTYQAMATSGNPYELEQARLAKEAAPLFMDRFNEGPQVQEDLALATDADWAVFAAKTDHDARLMAALEGLIHKAEDRLPQPEAGWADKRAAFVIAANRLFGVEQRAGGHATDAQLLRSHYAITGTMINVMREQQRYGVTKEYAEKYLAFFNDETAPMELRRMGATVYEYYLIQNQKREEDLRVRNVAQSEFNEVRPEATMLAVETGGSGGSLYGGCNWYDAGVYQAPNQIGTKGRELLAKVTRLEATHSLLELRLTYAGDEKIGAPGMAKLLREYGAEHRNVAEKTLYVLGGWIKQAYQGSGVVDQDAEVAAKIHDVNDMVFEIDRALGEVAQGDMARFQMVNHVHGYGSTFHAIGKLTEEARAVIVYRDIVQDIEAMALASVATAGVGAAMGLTMRTGKLTNDLLRATKMLVRIVGRQATFLHVNAAGKWLMRGQQDLYDFSKGYRYNLFNLGVQIVEFELMGMAHHQVRALRQLKDVAKSASTLRTVLATTAKFSHDVVRDTLFFHGWTPFGAAIRGFAHGDMAEIQGGIEALGSAEGFHHSLVLTFGLGIPIGRAPSKMAVKYALKHGIREMKPVAARQERIAALEQQIATLAARGASDSRTPTLIFELRQQQEQIAAHNAQVMEKLTDHYRDSEELKQQAQAMKAQVDHSRFNTATAQQTELKHRLEVAQGANAPAVQQIALLKRAEQASQVRATLATRLLHHQMLPAQVAMATQLEATYFRNQRQLAENGQQIEKLERAMARPEISNDALLAKSSRLALALQKHIALMEEVNALAPDRFPAKNIEQLRQRRATLLTAMPRLKGQATESYAETTAAADILHRESIHALETQAQLVRGDAPILARARHAASHFMDVWRQLGDETSPARRMLTQALLLPVAPFIGTMGSGVGGAAKGQSTLVTELSRGKPELRDWKPGDTIPSLDQLVRTPEDVTLLIALGEHRTDVWPLLHTLAGENPAVFTSEHRQKLEAIPHKDPAVESTLERLARRRLDLFSRMTADSVAQLSSTDCARHAAELRLRLNVGKTWEQNTALGEYTLLITHGHLSADAYRNEAAALITDAAQLAIDSLGRYQAAFEMVVSQGGLTHADMNALVESDRFSLPAEWPQLEGKAQKRYKNNLKWWITRYSRPLKVFRNGVALPALLMNVGGTPRQIYELLVGTPNDTNMPFEFESRDGHTLATQTAQKEFNLNRGGKNLGLEIHISVPELLEFARTHPDSIDPTTNYISIRGAALPEFQKFVREHAIPVRILIPMELSSIHLPILARHLNIHIQYLSARDQTLTPDAQAAQWASEAAIPSRRADVQALNIRLFTEGGDDAFAAAGARNNFDNGMIFFSPYSPALFFLDAEVDPGTGAIRSLKARSTKKLSHPDPTTIDASVAIFSPWASATLYELHSKAMKMGLRDRDPVPAWILTEIGQIVETHAEMSIEGTRITTQFAKWFSVINSPALTLGEVFSDRVMDIYGKNLPPKIETDLQGALIGKPFRTRRGSPIPIPSKGSADTHGAAPPLSVHSSESSPRLGIVGVGKTTEYPPLTQGQRLPWEADSITTQEFHDAIVDHFHPMYFNDTRLQKRREGIIDRWTMHEYKIERDIITSARTPVLRATDAFLARTRARSEAFVALLDLRVEAQLRNKFGAHPHLTDMDIEAERNRILAEILSAGLGTYLPIARGKISVSTADGVIVLRPSHANDYAAIDQAIQSGDNPGEVLTGGFYCHKSALRLPFIVINPAMGERAFSIFRHEIQHLRKHASNRFEPHFTMPTPDAVPSYPEALRQHFGISAKDEILAYLEGATPPRDTIATLTKPGGIYDAIAKARDKIKLSDDDIATLTQEHNTYVAHQVWATNEAIVDLVSTEWHPDAARRALINSLSGVPFMNWEMQLPMAVSALLAAPPQRQAPPPAARDAQRAELRVWLETEILPNRSKGWKKLDARAQKQTDELSSIAQELRGTVRVERLQELRRYVEDGNSELEQLAEVLQFMTDECRGQLQVVQQRTAANSNEAKTNAAQWRKLTKKLEHLVLLSGLRLTRYLRASNLAKVQDRLDRLLLLQTAHSQQLLSDSAEKTLEAQTPSIARPRIRETDVARMRVEDQLSHIYKLRNAMAQATAPDEVVRAASLYATYVRHGLLTRQMRAFEFEALMDIAQAHPEWMPHLKYAFLGISGTMMPEQWQHILQGAMPVQPAAAPPKTTLSIGNKTRALHTIEGYRQQMETSPHGNSHISKAIDALELALRRGEPIPQVVVRYGMLIPDMINHAILNGASKENMARYFIVKEGQRPPTPKEPWLTVMEVTVPLDRFVRFLMKRNLPLDIDDTHIITTERTNAAFNHFLMHSFVRRHVAVQEGLLTPELVFHARRGVISLEVRAASEAEAAPPSRQSIHSMNAISGGEQRVAELAQKPWDSALAQLRKHFGENLATRARDHRSEIDAFLTHMGITPSALELETFLGGGGLDIRLDLLTPYVEQLKLLPQSLLTQLFAHQLLHPQMLRTLETSGTISRHGFEPTLRLLATLATGTPTDKERQLQAMGYSAEGAREIVSTIVDHLPFGAVDILSLILPHSEADAIAALRMAKDSSGNFSRHSLRQASTILKDSEQAGIPLSPDELKYMTSIQASARTDMVVTNSLNAVDRMMTMESLHFRYEFLRRLYGDTHAIPEHNQAAVATVPLNDRYTLKLETGIYESACGMQVTLYERDPVQGELELGSIGFQESSTGIEVVGYQGADLGQSQRTDSATQFRAFSGGVDPMPWLAVLTGQTLLTQASTQGKTLRWISGERIKMGYPHLKGMSPPHITSVQDARGPWDGHPQHAAIMTEYDALIASKPKKPSDIAERDRRLQKLEDYVKVFRAGERRTAKLYDATAQNLGFRRKGNDAAWHRYTKDPAEFGSAILNSRDVDRERMQASLQATHAAIRADEKFNIWATSPQRPPKRIFPAQSADKVTLEDFVGILSRDFGDEHFPHEDLLLARNEIGDHLLATEDRMNQIYDAARAKTKDPVARQRLATDQFLVRTRARTDTFLRILELRVQSKLRSQFGGDAAITELDQEAALRPIIVEILNESFSGPPLPALKGHIDITDRDGVLVLRPENPDDFASLRNVIANSMDTNQNLPFGFFNAISALGIPIVVISPECSEEAWVIMRHELDHYIKFASNRFERGALPPIADNLMRDGKLNPAAQTRYMNGMRDYLFKIAKDETLAHLTNVRAPRDVLADLTLVGGEYDFITKVKAELVERIANGVGGTTVSIQNQDPMTAQDYALSRIDTMRARHNQGITKNIWLLYDAVETLVDHGYHPEMARLTLIHALTPAPYTQWPTQLPKIVAQLSGQPARTMLPESFDPQDHHFRLRRWLERDNPALEDVKALIDDHTAAIEKTQGELAQPASAARLQQLRQEWRHQISEPQQLLEVLHLMLGELECRKEVMQRRGNNLPEVIRLTAKIDRFKLLIDTAKTQGQLTAMKLLKLQTAIDKQLRGHSAHVQTKIQGGTVRNSMSAMGALAMADLGVGLHQAWLSVADTVATHPYALTAAAAAIVGATLFASRFTESGRLRNVIKTLGIKDLIAARSTHPEDPILSLNAFLRGELGREPTLAEVRTFEQHTWEYRERAAIYGREVPGELQILQIYNKEFVDALAARITATAQEFRQKQGRDPVIVEIAAGDGRLSRALRKRGIMITATDAHEWHRGGSHDVEDHVPWAMAMRRGDIILGSWLPAAQDRSHDDFDVPIAQHLIEHPDKTFIQIEAACTNTRRFKDFVSAEQQKGALFIDEPPEFTELLTSRLGNNTPLDHEDELTALLVPRTDNRTHLRIYRGTEERPPAFLGIPSVLPAHGGMSQIHYSGAPFIADLARQAVAGVLNFFGVGHPTNTPLPAKPSDKPAAAVPAYTPPHWKDLMPGKLDVGDPIWLQHVDSALADAGSYQNAYRHMMHNAFATRWDAHDSPTKFNFDTDPWTNSRFLTALRAIRHRMAAELAANHFVGIDTADHQMSRYTFKSLGEFDAFVVTEIQRIRDSEIPPARPAPELDPRNARIFNVGDILSELGKTAPLLHIEGVSIPREFKEGDRVEIGRDGPNNDISFPTDDLVSRAHAVIVFERRGEFIGRVTDLLSANATKVIRDGVTTTLRDGEQFKLKVGDCVQVGSQRIYVGEPPPRSKPGEDPAPTSVVPTRFREGEARWREEYHPRTRDMDHIWRVRKNEEGGRQRLVDIFRANALRDPSQRRWPINFVVQAKPGAPDDSLVLVGQRFWPGQTVPEAGVKHIQIANGEYAQWAGELRGIFDAQGQLLEVQFNASSGEFGQQSLNTSQDEDIRIVRNLLAKILHIEATRVRFIR